MFSPVSLLARSSLLFASLIALSLPPARASGGGGEGASGPAPMNFIVNVGKTGRGGVILQLQLVMVPAKPESAKLIDDFKPMLQHRVLIVVAGMSPEALRTQEGRQELAEALVEELNTDLETDEKSGIKEVFFTSFIFQQM
ncbi:flagellar basal body-associated FliL family protein [Uliginosibacterium aquaticum]|uniref:Flagellar protein FliL n=1 Tax=Uliginosibacterium aquaticum TaxID=2731212 RepID=A0ABX2IRE0_9RHOO|nr:flagellar basal body-associated FliL family protein [Uliginosibacterium aquaticum]NSL56560.1 flagellar basal body-associated FliL family protein [Uliginosibacterium aquaticum]